MEACAGTALRDLCVLETQLVAGAHAGMDGGVVVFAVGDTSVEKFLS